MQKRFSRESLAAAVLIATLFVLFASAYSQAPCSNTVLPLDATQPVSITLRAGIPIYFNLTFPKEPLSTLLVKVQYSSLSCSFNSSTATAIPQLFIGHNDCPTSTSYFRKNVNITLVETGRDVLQAIAVYPAEHRGKASTSSFVVGIEQDECPQIDALILATSLGVMDFTGSKKPKTVTMFPSVKQFFLYSTVNEHQETEKQQLQLQQQHESVVEEGDENPEDFSDEILVIKWNFLNLEPVAFVQPTRVYTKKNDFPREDGQDPQTFSYNSHEFALSPVEKNTIYYFSVQYDLSIETQTDMSLMVQVFPGKQCGSGCGEHGACNFTDGTCSCPNGYWGDSCSIEGCASFEPCTVKGGKGLKQCYSPQSWSCLNVTCEYSFFYKYDGNQCSRFFPEEIVIYMTVGVCLLSIFVGFMGGSCICAIRYNSKSKRRHYHNI